MSFISTDSSAIFYGMNLMDLGVKPAKLNTGPTLENMVLASEPRDLLAAEISSGVLIRWLIDGEGR